MQASTVTAVFSANGDTYRSLIACHLACGKGRQGLVFDLGSPFAAMAALLDSTPAKTWADLIPVAHELTPELVVRAVSTTAAGIPLLAAPDDLLAEPLTPGTLHAILTHAKARYPHVVLDVGAGLQEAQRTALKLADRVALVVPGDIPGVQQGRRVLHWLQGQGIRDGVRVIVAETAMPRPLNLRELERLLGPVMAVLPWEPTVVVEARNLGEPLKLRRSALEQALGQMVAAWEIPATPDVAATPARRWGSTGDLLKGLFQRGPQLRPSMPQPSE